MRTESSKASPAPASHVVLGLGATGLSVVRYLHRMGITPIVMDSRSSPPGHEELARDFADVALITNGFDCRYLVQAQQIIISPGIALSTPEVRVALDMGIEVIGDVELFARAVTATQPQAKIIAITGSNGKTTVTTLVGDMVKAAGVKVAVGGNIGVPALDLLATESDVYVLELSSFQLETTSSLKCAVATCLNISEDHMDRYPDLQSYRQAKLSIYAQARVCLINREDKMTHSSEPGHYLSFGLNEPDGDDWGIREGELVHGQSRLMACDDVGLMGRHNLANVLAAMALCDAVDIKRSAMVSVAQQFTGLPHRCQSVASVNGVTFIDDSKATNVGATLAALDGFADFAGQIILIAGGDAKGADIAPLQPALQRVAQLITLGRDGPKIAALKPGAIAVTTMSEAVNTAFSLCQTGDMVLLSPACASLDMYPNYMARGRDFAAAAEALHGSE
ncbi:UDP-N-acetylmuramoyl-L-alanine--D-glutamate ligase [Shewanella sp. NIFS-20-20]|uniref:UDP-N-acetylmuramoyl-L-alanine--D-glutamate ligase n=1 Tax=Shewanella sp. NIFS-20-20 TaxID=2853806 RepID=UPI001C44BBF4|nr:UDP-N-acetylmuramoyl-L-alanine--D-glutamate ligase [Shewanella sp. NIFS-20-20]MBV7315755.1 UDP-N-acetylmuramoyl-L-alanine--D-glutamate ligase [Shewanella sp. NIFS-20-20]